MVIINNMKKSKLSEAPPSAVSATLQRLGQNIRIARLRRRLRLEDLAERIGISRQVMADIEKGKPTTGIVAYLAALWAMGLLDDMQSVADPDRDEEGKILESRHRPSTAAKRRKELDNDF